MKIITNRFREGSDFTISKFKTSDEKVNGYFLEPAGPDETRSGLDRRVPIGIYKTSHYSSIKFPNNIILFNDIVSIKRIILVHSGNRGIDTFGCLLAGSAFTANMVTDSNNKLQELMLWYNAQPKGSVFFDIGSSIKT